MKTNWDSLAQDIGVCIRVTYTTVIIKVITLHWIEEEMLHTFSPIVKPSIFSFLLGYQKPLNSENPRVAYTLVLISNSFHCKTQGND